MIAPMSKSAHKDDYKFLLACLIEARQEAGLRQKDIADRLSKPQSYVSKYEHGERRIDVVEFIAIAKAIGIDPLSVIKKIL